MTQKLEQFGTLIYKTVAGSHSYGTNHELSDKDIRGIFIPHRKYLVGLEKVEEFQDLEEEDTVYFSLQKFVSLALEGNPNVVEQLFVNQDHILFSTEIGQELRDMRYEFLTKNAYGRFGGYAFAQMKRLNEKNNGSHHGSHKHIIDEYGYDTKHAMHLVRLFNMGIQILEHRELNTYRPEREYLLEIRYGKYTLKEIQDLAVELNIKLEEAMMKSNIPDYPDFDKVNSWIVRAIDRAHGLHTTKGLFKGAMFNVLPLEYEMVDKCALLTVANRLNRHKDKSKSYGVAIPYKDWYIGLREFTQFKFENAVIESIHKTVTRARQADPKVIDLIFAGKQKVIYEHPMAKEFKQKLASLLTTKAVYNKTKNYVTGNLKKMQHWENLKTKWEEKKKESDKHLSIYPPVPDKTTPENAGMMTKFGYDTLLAYDLVHVLKLANELLATGTIKDSRTYESELYAIKHGKYKTFNEFNKYLMNLLSELETAKVSSQLPSNDNFNELQDWVVDFIERFHNQLD